MVAKISIGSSLYGALAYNGEKINKEEGRLLATNKIFDNCTGKLDIARAMKTSAVIFRLISVPKNRLSIYR